MKRRILAATLVLIFPIGMAACGSQSKAAACEQVQKAADKASKEVLSSSSSTGTPSNKTLRDRVDKTAAVYKASAKKVKNKKVKKLYNAFVADMEKIVEIYDDGDTDFTSSQFDSTMDSLDANARKLSDTCNLHWDFNN